MKKRLISFTLILHILIFSLVPTFYKPMKVEAVATTTTVLGITGFILSCIGAVNILSNGGVGRASSQAVDAVKEKVADLMGTGIYEDSNGNYVFSGQATQDIYNALQGSQPTRTVSSFQGASFMGGCTYYNTAYLTADAVNTLNSWRSLYNDYLICINRLGVGSGTMDMNGRYCVIYDLSNVAYLNLSAYDSNKCWLNFYNVSGQQISVDCKTFYCSASRGITSSVYSGTSSSCSVVRNKSSFDDYDKYICNITYYMQDNDISNPSSWSQFAYNNFPFVNYTGSGGTVCWANKSVILSTSSGAGLSKATQQEGLIIANSFNQFPTISKTVIENNDWDYIYQSYVNNVNSQSSNYYDGSSIDTEKLLEYMQAYCNNINNAIQEGTENIEQAVLTSNEWLQRIYQRLAILQDILNNMGNYGSGGGSGGSVWTSEDIETLLDLVDRIDSNMSLSLEEMQDIYTILGSILDAIEAGASPSTPNYTLPGIDVPFDEITNLPSSDVLDAITNTQIIVRLLEDTFLFGSVFLISGALEMLSAQPVAPSFSIPVKMESLMQVDETIDIDFADFGNSFDFIREIVGDLLCLLFILMLIKLTNELLSFVIDLVS